MALVCFWIKEARDSPTDAPYIDIGVLLLSGGKMQWHDVWNLFGWEHCDAMVEPQGFTPDGRIVVLARPSAHHGHLQPDCVREEGLYATDVKWSKMNRLPDTTAVERYAERLHPAFQACKPDPDIIGECFKVHGRVMFTNGTPGIRIWRIGTHRIVGVQTELLPEKLAAEMGWNAEAYGDFIVCPFTPQRPGEMQMVCVESAEKVHFVRSN
jgi:hypothetical protein